LSKVTLPLFVNYVDDIILFKEKFRETIKLISFVTCFVTGVIFLIVPFMIEHYMGTQWMESIKIFEILCLGLLFNPIHSMNLNILNVYGRSDIFLMLEIIKKGVQIVVIIVCYQFGITGLVIGFVGLSVFSLFVNLYYTQYFIKYSVFTQLLDIIPNIFVGFLCIVISKYIMLNQLMSLYLLGIQVIVFVSLYYLLSYFSNKLSFYYVKKVVLSIVQKYI
jgi:teichuronic acid exporter